MKTLNLCSPKSFKNTLKVWSLRDQKAKKRGFIFLSSLKNPASVSCTRHLAPAPSTTSLCFVPIGLNFTISSQLVTKQIPICRCRNISLIYLRTDEHRFLDPHTVTIAPSGQKRGWPSETRFRMIKKNTIQIPCMHRNARTIVKSGESGIRPQNVSVKKNDHFCPNGARRNFTNFWSWKKFLGSRTMYSPRAVDSRGLFPIISNLGYSSLALKSYTHLSRTPLFSFSEKVRT